MINTFVSTVRTSTVRYARMIALMLALVAGGVGIGAYAPVVLGQTSDLLPAASTIVQDGGEHYLETDPFIRTELFFGTNRPDGTVVTEEQFNRFIDREVTPRFPDGLTLLTGYGQFRDSKDKIIEEQSKLLILLYPLETKNDSSAKIEAIRQAYKDRFDQESVLRVDDARPVRTSF